MRGMQQDEVLDGVRVMFFVCSQINNEERRIECNGYCLLVFLVLVALFFAVFAFAWFGLHADQ